MSEATSATVIRHFEFKEEWRQRWSAAAVTSFVLAGVVTLLLLITKVVAAMLAYGGEETDVVAGQFGSVLFFTIALFGNGLASIGWSLISSAAPRRLIGLTGGAFNGVSNLSGIVTPMIIGYLAANGNFAPGLIYIACVALVGVCAYVFLIGKLEPVE